MLSPSQPGITREKGARYPSVLLAVYSIWWLILAIHPEYPKDWLLENLLVFVALGLLIRFYRNLRFSDFSYTMVFIFLCIHAVGAHYTYAEVPYREWLGLGLDGRNHFDRLVHFL